MKGNDKVIDVINELIADELTAIAQYIVHMGMFGNWKYKHLEHHAFKRAKDEMKHLDKLIDRILFLDGTPKLQSLNKLHIGDTVDAMIENDRKAEVTAIEHYNSAIKLAEGLNDNNSAELFEDNLEEEEGHIDYLEAKQQQIKDTGLDNFLATQI